MMQSELGASATPKKELKKSEVDECIICAFSFTDHFVNNAGKLVKGYTRKRPVSESDRRILSSFLEVHVPLVCDICSVCQSLVGKLERATNQINEAKCSIKEKLANIPVKKKRTIQSPTGMTPESKKFLPLSRNVQVVTKKAIQQFHAPKSPMRVLPLSPLSRNVQVVTKKVIQQFQVPKSTMQDVKYVPEKITTGARRRISLSSGKTQIQIILATPSGVTEKIIDPVFHPIARDILSQDSTSMVKHAIEFNRRAVVQHIAPVVKTEVSAICAPKFNCVLRQTDREGLQNFSFHKLFKEVKDKCPVLLSVICSAMDINPISPTDADIYHLGCLLAPVLKFKNNHMSALSYHVGFLLKSGGLSQQSQRRMAKMGYSISPTAIDNKVKQLSDAVDHDTELLLRKWTTSVAEIKICKALLEALEVGPMILTKPIVRSLSTTLREVQISGPSATDINTLVTLIDSGFPVDVSDYTIKTENIAFLNAKCTPVESPSKFSLAGDNWDKRIIPTYMGSTKTQDLHLFMLILCVDRVTSHLDNSKPQKDVSDLSYSDYMPSVEDQTTLSEELVHIIGQSGVDNIPSLHKEFASTYPKTIPHQYATVMAQKSKQYPIGLFDINESKSKDMIRLLKMLSEKYVPTFVSFAGPVEVAEPLFFGGDRLTDERAQAAKRAMADSGSSVKRLEGIIPKCEDFHREMNFMEAIHKVTYSKESAPDYCTAVYLRNLLKFTNVTANVKTSYRANKWFYYLVHDAQICHMLMEELNMEDLDDTIEFPEAGKLVWYHSKCRDIVKKYFLTHEDIYENVRKEMDEESSHEHSWQLQLNDQNRYKCHYCDVTYVQLNCAIAHEKRSHGVTRLRQRPRGTVNADGVDDIFNYQMLFFRLLLLHRNLETATNAGDGPRAVRSSKYELCIYSKTNKIKYMIACIQLQTLIQAKLSANQAHRLTWNRTVNVRGGIHNNEAIDGHIELINREVKKLCKGNQTKQSCLSQAALYKVQMSMIHHMDEISEYRPKKGIHNVPQRDSSFRKVLSELQEKKVLQYTPGRAMKCTKLRSDGSVSSCNGRKLIEMLARHKQMFDVLH